LIIFLKNGGIADRKETYDKRNKIIEKYINSLLKNKIINDYQIMNIETKVACDSEEDKKNIIFR